MTEHRASNFQTALEKTLPERSQRSRRESKVQRGWGHFCCPLTSACPVLLWLYLFPTVSESAQWGWTVRGSPADEPEECVCFLLTGGGSSPLCPCCCLLSPGVVAWC